MRIDVKIDLKAFWSVSATILPFAFAFGTPFAFPFAPI